ncbi:ATP-dependent helicase [Kibdelosporangium persicum]|uniref:ATP-dependent helicase n=1 Tax=Kibdelosporangium persicum TaxID=2698649 RepID=UPI0035E44CFD
MVTKSAPLLVRAPHHPRADLSWDDAATQLIEGGGGGFCRVLGGPGTGKTTLLAELAAKRIKDGADPESLLILTASRRAATALRTHITRLLTDMGMRTVRDPLVRTVHSYAFAVLRLQASLRDEPGPRLLSGPEQDAVVRDLLEGDLERGADYWPKRLKPALTIPGFADELRDLLLRAAERGVGPEDLAELGRRYSRDEWVAAGLFGKQYEQVTLLAAAADTGVAHASGPALDAAELVDSALVAFETDEELLDQERTRVRHLYVDDAQHLDPLQFQLVETLAEGATEYVLAGDPDQAIFSFRGADPRLLADADPSGGNTVVLTTGHRMATQIREAVGRLAGRLPGTGPQRQIREGRDVPADGNVALRLHPSAAAEASWVADQLRRAHLIDEIPWSEMAVVVRSATRSIPVLYRALAAAGVPVAIPTDEVPLAQQPAVRPFLALLECAADPNALDAEMAAMLLSSPLGGADPMALRRLRRGLRRLELAAEGDRSSDELLVEALNSNDRLAALDDAEAAPLRRVGALLAEARKAIAEGAGVEQVLWGVWQGSGLERRWVAQAERGGTSGAQADRDLDAIVGLFHAAAKYADRLPGAGVGRFAEYLGAQQIAGDSLAQKAPIGESVALLTAHAAAGREWTVVAVPGVQEGAWPDLRLRGSLLGVEQMVDVLNGADPYEYVSMTAPILAEERRLFMVAASRARWRLLVSAIRGEEEQPSRFLGELAEFEDEELAFVSLSGTRSLVLADLVGELRKVVCDGEEPAPRRRRAARQLARLAEAGVPGAHPDSWYGLAELSSAAALREKTEPVKVSPSTVDVLAKCPLRWVVERHGGQDPVELHVITGTLVHALAQAAAEGANERELRAQLDEAWKQVDAGAPWYSKRERQRVHGMLDTFLSWLTGSRSQLTQVAIEQDVSVDLPQEEDGPLIRLRGRVDRLEADADKRPVVIDIKSGKTPVSKDEAAQHPQLAVYQLAAAYGAFVKLGLDTAPGGARLVFVAKKDRRTGAAERVQEPVEGEAVQEWLSVVRKAAADSIGPDYDARENPDCPRCPAKTSCPLHPAGRQVTE